LAAPLDSVPEVTTSGSSRLHW